MARPPRKAKERLFNRRTLALSVLQGTSILVIILLVFVVSHGLGLSDDEERALVFAALVFANLSLIVSNRSWTESVFSSLRSKNNALWGVLAFTALFLLAVIYVPYLNELFHFVPLGIVDVCFVALVGVSSLAIFEGFKAALVMRGGKA
jgi:Ca2+-transporting ATPase